MTEAAVTQGKGCARWFVCDDAPTRGGDSFESDSTMPRVGVSRRRLRSGWRVGLFAVVARLVQIIAAIVFALGVGVILGVMWSNQDMSPAEFTNRLASEFSNLTSFSPLAFGFRLWDTLVILVLVFLFRRFLDKRPFRSLGFQLSRGWWVEALAGFTFAVAAWGVIFVLSFGLGAATIVGFAWDSKDLVTILSALATGLLFNFLVGIAEEADARGYMLQNLAEGVRFAPAVIVSSAYFGILHLLNPGAGMMSTIGIFFAGVLLAMGFFATRRLWFSIGMHAAWNFAEGPIFGFLVSGLDMGGLFQLQVTGPEWLMGGKFGPEAGALAVAVEIAMIAALWTWARSRRWTTGDG